LISALQSHLYNQWLVDRIADGVDRRVLAGDVLTKPATGGLFVSTEPAADQARLDAGEVAITGPMFGSAMRAPPPGTEAAAREARVLAAAGLDAEAFVPLGKLATGTRRAATVVVEEPAVLAVASGAIRVTFSLPAGSYATAILREVQKSPTGFGTPPYPASDEPGDTPDLDPSDE
jgi:tRNA pseudouridine13 synthase